MTVFEGAVAAVAGTPKVGDIDAPGEARGPELHAGGTVSGTRVNVD